MNTTKQGKSVTIALTVILFLLTLGLSASLFTQNTIPEGWHISGSAPENYLFRVDTLNMVDGSRSAMVSSKANITGSKDGFGTLMQTISAKNYLGQRVQLKAYLKSEISDGSTGAWFRVDGLVNGQESPVSMDNMQNRRLTNTSDWNEYFLVLDVPQSATDLNFGVLLVGKGKVWLDNLTLQAVDFDTPTTATWVSSETLEHPCNLSFEDNT